MSEAGPQRERPLVLVADDDASTRFLVRTTLELAGFDVAECEDGRRAVSEFARLKPKVVVLDVLMPGMDGFQACAEIRRTPGGETVPVLMLTGLDDVESINKAYEAGATDFAVKPINWTILGHRVRYMLRASQILDDLRVSEARERHLEAQIFQAQKIEAVGRLAGGVAHDFNNVLTVIMGYCDLIEKGLRAEDPLRRYAVEGQKNLGRAASLTKQLLAFSRKQILSPQPIDLNAVVSGMEDMLRRLIGEHVDLVVAPAPALRITKADRGQIEQVIMNLAVNARDAMPEGGKLTIETANVDLDEAYARGHLPVKPGSYVMLAVTDTGVGMDEETTRRIFEPFFTTKEMGKGTGLGLSTVYGIVKQSGGYIWVESSPGRGTAFKIHLPPSLEAAARPPAFKPAADSASGTETILVVEDEDGIRELVSKVLGLGGYTVLSAAGGKEAAAAVDRHEGPIHLMLTDMVMPGMSGPELADRLKSKHSSMKVLYMSGYADDAVLRHGELAPGMPFLQKPFTSATLTQKIREVLGGRG
jgi:signal transduction histidine kinase